MIKKEDFNNLKTLCTDQETQKLDKEFLKSITGMQHGKGMIEKEDFDNLKTFCTDQENNLDKELLKSITGMQHRKGMIEKEDLIKFNNYYQKIGDNVDGVSQNNVKILLLLVVTGNLSRKIDSLSQNNIFVVNKILRSIETEVGTSDVVINELIAKIAPKLPEQSEKQMIILDNII